MKKAHAEAGPKTSIGVNVDIGAVELIIGGAVAVFGPPGAMGAVIKYKLNGHLDKITETNDTVKEIQTYVYDIDKRVIVLETKEEVASSP